MTTGPSIFLFARALSSGFAINGKIHSASARPVREVLAGLVRALIVWTIRRNVCATCLAH